MSHEHKAETASLNSYADYDDGVSTDRGTDCRSPTPLEWKAQGILTPKSTASQATSQGAAGFYTPPGATSPREGAADMTECHLNMGDYQRLDTDEDDARNDNFITPGSAPTRTPATTLVRRRSAVAAITREGDVIEFSAVKEDSGCRLFMKRFRNYIVELFPFWRWIVSYKRSYLFGDIVAGLTVGILLMPQAAMYAKIADVPKIRGLYSALLGPLIYAFLGSSRQVSVGPGAVVALLTKRVLDQLEASCKKYGEFEDVSHDDWVLMLTLEVGVIQLFCGLLQTGLLLALVSRPVFGGLMLGLGLIVCRSQTDILLGIEPPSNSGAYFFDGLYNVGVAFFDRAREYTAICSAITVILLLMFRLKWLKFIGPRGGLMIIIVSTIVCLIAQPSKDIVAVIGELPSGLPPFEIPPFVSMNQAIVLLPSAIQVVLAGYLETYASARNLAAQYGYLNEIDASQELVALGVCNVVCSFFHCIPVNGVLSRSSVSVASGARTPMASLVCGLTVLVTLTFATAALKWTPMCVLAAIIVVGVLTIINPSEVAAYWKLKRVDSLSFIIAGLVTLMWGPSYGLIASVAWTLIILIHRTSRPHIYLMGRLPGTTVFKPAKKFPDAKQFQNTIILRMEESIFFGNVQYLRYKINKFEMMLEKSKNGPLKTLVIDATGINRIDSSGLLTLEEIVDYCTEKQASLFLSHVNEKVLRVLWRSKKLHQSVVVVENNQDAIDEIQRKTMRRVMSMSPTIWPAYSDDEEPPSRPHLPTLVSDDRRLELQEPIM